ncbi:MAG: L-threonylcarbamoyladenylate synthase [Balneolaceae bacterium]|nr:L-threonylcarbamoyladenylate synthase [Balneolaceae bacterium]
MLERIKKILREGGVAAFPTETVYGLGAYAWNPDAVRRVFELKGRPADNPLIVHLASARMAADFVPEIPEDARTLMTAFWPGPLTLILPKKPEVLDLVTAGLDTVALRWPAHPLAQELIATCGPLVAPSANKSGRPSPTRPEHVREDFGEDFPVLEAGETQIGLESTVLDLSREPYTILRPGYIGREQIEKALGKEVRLADSEEGEETDGEIPGRVGQTDADAPARSPGTKYSHYAPSARVRWMEEGEEPGRDNTLYLIHAETAAERPNVASYESDYERMARELYDRFRQADREGYAQVALRPFTADLRRSKPVAEALHNRISKAIG